MSHFAKLDQNNTVTQVIVAEQDFIDNHTTGVWVQTSYNTNGGIHSEGGEPLRKNYAGIGYAYDAGRDAFIAPKPYLSWVLDENTCQYKAPVAYPLDGKNYIWSEDTTSWIGEGEAS